MKKNSLLFALIPILVFSCKPNQELRLLITNPLDQPRNDAVLIISREEISDWTTIQEGKVPLLVLPNGTPLPTQLDDLNGDGKWDELFSLTNLGPSEEKRVVLSFIAKEDYPVFEARTNLRLGANKPGYPELETADRLEGVAYHNYGGITGEAFQMEGPAWENDNVGFRNYLDQRNGMDIFGKLTTRMVLDSVGIAGKSSYHEHAEWGMDVLKVGTSLGAGGIGYMYNDSIYRVGDNGAGTYKVIFEGSQRSRIDLSYTNWKVEDSPMEVRHQIDIVAGQHCFQSDVTYLASETILDLVTGIVNIKSDSLYQLDLNEHFKGLMTFDHQAEDSSLLAMALMVPTAYLETIDESKESGEGITQTYYAVLDAQADKAVPYRFYALWEKEDPRWASLDEIKHFLKSEADRWANSVLIQAVE